MNRLGFLLLIWLLSSGIVHAASFDCAKSTTSIEKLVCSNARLSRLDEMLAAAYSEAKLTQNSEQLVQQQRLWLRKRAACTTAACLEDLYARRIVELRECLRDLNTGECATFEVARESLPHTTDGRLMLLTRAECRIGFEGGIETSGHAEAIEIHADCIEADVYDPCEDAGGRWGEAQCVWAHLEVAQRRIRRVTNTILGIADSLAMKAQAQKWQEANEKAWKQWNESECSKRQKHLETLDAKEDGSRDYAHEGAEPYGFCKGRLARERADRMENWVQKLKAASNHQTRLKVMQEVLSQSGIPSAQ